MSSTYRTPTLPRVRLPSPPRCCCGRRGRERLPLCAGAKPWKLRLFGGCHYRVHHVTLPSLTRGVGDGGDGGDVGSVSRFFFPAPSRSHLLSVPLLLMSVSPGLSHAARFPSFNAAFIHTRQCVSPPPSHSAMAVQRLMKSAVPPRRCHPPTGPQLQPASVPELVLAPTASGPRQLFPRSRWCVPSRA